MQNTQAIDAAAQLQQVGMSSVQYLGNGMALFNNGHIAISKDLIFGLTVWTGESWFPISDCDQEEMEEVRGLIAKGTIQFPWHDLIAKRMAELKAG